MNARWLFSLSLFPIILLLGSSTGFGFELGTAPKVNPTDLETQLDLEKVNLNNISVDTSSRDQVIRFYYDVYLASEGIDAGWSGSLSECRAGTPSSLFRDAVLLRINYYRAMAGLPGNIFLNSTWNNQCQKAALMMIAEATLSHNPINNPEDPWHCWSSEGAEAAANSLLAISVYGPDAIDGYMEDSEPDNAEARHRRWILYPRQLMVGTGSTTAQNSFYLGSDALWVKNGWSSRPANPEWVAWPPSGYVPYSIVFPRWSFSCNAKIEEVAFTNAEVTMTQSGNPVPLTMEPRTEDIYGDKTLVWTPEGIPSGAPEEDLIYQVTISGVSVDEVTREYQYEVIIIDPGTGCWPVYDLNNDHEIDSADLLLLLDDLSEDYVYRSDFNCDQKTDYQDLIIFSTFWDPQD